MAGKILKIACSTMLCLFAFDAIGLLISSVVDLDFSDFFDYALCYAFWMVLGGFCGMLNYFTAARWASPGPQNSRTNCENAAQIDRLIRATSFSLLVALSILLFLVLHISEDSSHYVPVNVSLTLTFFGATAGVILFCSKTVVKTEGVAGVRN